MAVNHLKVSITVDRCSDETHMDLATEDIAEAFRLKGWGGFGGFGNLGIVFDKPPRIQPATFKARISEDDCDIIREPYHKMVKPGDDIGVAKDFRGFKGPIGTFGGYLDLKIQGKGMRVGLTTYRCVRAALSGYNFTDEEAAPEGYCLCMFTVKTGLEFMSKY